MERIDLGITGVAGSPMDSVKIKTTVYLYPEGQHKPLKLEAYGLRHIGITTPASTPTNGVPRLSGLWLADSNFATPTGIDMILGANIYGRLLQPGIQRRGSLLAQNTIFGWIITGATREISTQCSSIAIATTITEDEGLWHEKLIGLLQKFWQIEKIPRKPRLSDDDLNCENLFIEQYRRDSLGRYIVPLLLKITDRHALGSSLPAARLALLTQHRRMQRDEKLKQEYVRFMDEYLQEGHMRRLSPEEIDDDTDKINYIPHHGIWQKGNNASKIRVVFDASRKPTSGCSLNDSLHAGPKLQNDLAAVITRWRTHKVAYCADIKMMFRQILIRSSDTHLQRIVWSSGPHETEGHFVLLTVTYGKTCAPYLALRILKQLCKDEGSPFPEAMNSIKHDLYVDDFLSGGRGLLEARCRRDELTALLRKGRFELKKWVSNQPELIEDIPPTDRLRPSWRHFEIEGLVNELGLAWDPVADQLRFTAPNLGNGRNLTKRLVLSELARLFNPVGWLAPLIVVGKMQIQDL